MKKMMKCTLRAILAITGITCFCVLMGEPIESLSCSEVVMIKASALAVMLGAIKIWCLTLTERERRELEEELS